MIQLKAVANTDIAKWPDEFVNVYLSNYLAGLKKEYCIGKIDSEVVIFKEQDSNKDLETNLWFISIPDSTGLS